MHTDDNASLRWRQSVLRWATSRLGPLDVLAVMTSPWSEVWTVQHRTGRFYLKGSLGALRSEPAMCRLIARVAGDGHCPDIIDVEPDLGCFLMASMGHRMLREQFEQDGFDLSLACRAYGAMQDLQILMSTHPSDAIACGSADWSPERLRQAFLAILDAPDGDALHQLLPNDLDRIRRRGIAVFNRAMDELNSIVPGVFWSNDDFNDKNVVFNGSRFGVCDLGETSIGPPLLNLYTSLSFFRRRHALLDASPQGRCLRDACLLPLGIPNRHRTRAWAACAAAHPMYFSVCLHRLIQHSSPALLHDQRYTHRMRDTLLNIVRSIDHDAPSP